MVEKSNFHDASLPGAACSRASGNPAKSLFADWIPAFAGTTGCAFLKGLFATFRGLYPSAAAAG
jgi:hypothetical protein